MNSICGYVTYNTHIDNNEIKLIIEKLQMNSVLSKSHVCHQNADIQGCVFGSMEDSFAYNPGSQRLLVVDGSAFNIHELSKELDLQKADYNDSFAELLLVGIERKGWEFLAMIDGAFTFAYYDNKRGELTLGRDSLGKRPLLYSVRDGHIVFSSELKPLLKAGLVDKEIDESALSQYLQLTYIPAPLSIIKDVFKLEAGTVVTVNASGNIQKYEYWHPAIVDGAPKQSDYELSKGKLKELVFSSVEQKLIASGDTGLLLSGGIDSTIMLGVMSRVSEKPIKTFTVGFDNKAFDETEAAQIAAKYHGAESKIIKFSENELTSSLENIIQSMDEPYADSSLLATYAVQRAARDYVETAFTGDGGDELFAGYDKYLVAYYSALYNKFPGIIRNGIIKPMVGLLPSESVLSRKANKLMNTSSLGFFEQRKYLMCLGFKEDELKGIQRSFKPEALDYIREQFDMLSNDDIQTRTQYVDIKTVLEGDMLGKSYKASMCSDFSTVAPLITSQMVDYSFSLPTEYKIQGKKRKVIFKDAFVDMIPTDILRHKKQGFGVPIGQWLETSLQQDIISFSDSDYLKKQGIFNESIIKSVVEEHFNHKINRYSELWAFLVFQMWYERNII